MSQMRARMEFAKLSTCDNDYVHLVDVVHLPFVRTSQVIVIYDVNSSAE